MGLLLGGIAVIFVLQNVVIITINFFSWQLTGSLAMILLTAILSGMLISALFIVPELIHNYFKNKGLNKKITQLEEELRKQEELTVFAKNVPPTAEDIKKIEDGAIANYPK
jgi:uncharacterized integral membrane protein